MKKLTLIIALLVSLQLGYAQKLVILHTNDTHSQIEPVRAGRDKGCGGVERRLQIINKERERYGEDNVLLLDAGDFNQGTPYFTICKGELEIDLVNELGYDVVTLGNHEFDNGVDDLAKRLKRAEFKVIGCNYDFSKTALKDLVEPYAIINKGGMKIGIVGAAARLEGSVAKSGYVGVIPLNTLDEMNRWAKFLKEDQNCDLVILLSHQGLEGRNRDFQGDMYLAENSKDIDLLVGGHSHTFLKQAVEVKNLDGKSVPIVQSRGQGVVIGKFEIF